MAQKKKPKIKKMEDPVKKAFAVHSYTPFQIEELKKCKEDIFYFIEHYVYIVHPVNGHVKCELYEYQKEVIRNLVNNKNNVLFISRQMGKSTCVVLYLLWLLMFKGQQTALLVSNIQSAAMENLDRFKYSYEYLPNWLKPGVMDNYNKTSVVFDNRSKIIIRATTKNSARGLSPSVVFSDELAAVEPGKQREFWSALSPTLSTGGKCIVASTPSNDEDVFARIVQGAENVFDDYGNELPGGIGRNGFKLTKFIWSAHPDRDETWEREQREKDGDEFFQREHCCHFISLDETLIDPLTLATMKGIDPLFSVGKVRWYKKPENNKMFLIALDPSMGVNKDFAAIQIFQLPEMIQIGEWQHNKTLLPDQIKLIRAIAQYIEEIAQNCEIFWSLENNNIGESCNNTIREIGEENIPGTYLNQKYTKGSSMRRKGFYTSNKTKVDACMRLKSLVERNKITLNSKALISQLKVFVSSGASFKGKGQEKDDLVMAAILAIRMLERVMSFEEIILDSFKESIEEDESAVQPLWGVQSSGVTYLS